MLKKWLISLGLLVVVALSSLYFLVYRYDYYTGKGIIEDYTILADGKTVVFKTGYNDTVTNSIRKQLGKTSARPNVMTGYQTIIVESVQLKKDPISTVLSKTKLDFGEYWYLTVYTLKDGKLVSKEIDLFSLFEQSTLDTKPLNAQSGIYYYDNKRYIQVEDSHLNFQWVNLDDEKIEIFSDETIEEIENAQQWHTPFSFIELLEDTKTSNFYSRGRQVGFKEPLTSSDSIALKTVDKKAFNLLTEQRSYLVALENLNLKEAATILKLFYPEGTNIFANVTIPAEYAVDGKKHEVHSYEEFAKYYKEGE